MLNIIGMVLTVFFVFGTIGTLYLHVYYVIELTKLLFNGYSLYDIFVK